MFFPPSAGAGAWVRKQGGKLRGNPVQFRSGPATVIGEHSFRRRPATGKPGRRMNATIRKSGDLHV